MRRSTITVLAGTNGAGKSSVGGALLLRHGANWYDPDRQTRSLVKRGTDPDRATALAWRQGLAALDRALQRGDCFAFETTLGGRTITERLVGALADGHSVRIWFAGLENPELHIERVRRRVERGGHDVPEERIRARYASSRRNLIRLLRAGAQVRVFDNSAEGDPRVGAAPQPRLLLDVRAGRITFVASPDRVPGWARPILAAALRLG